MRTEYGNEGSHWIEQQKIYLDFYLLESPNLERESGSPYEGGQWIKHQKIDLTPPTQKQADLATNLGLVQLKSSKLILDQRVNFVDVTAENPEPKVKINFKDDEIKLLSLLTEYSYKLETLQDEKILASIELKDDVILMAGVEIVRKEDFMKDLAYGYHKYMYNNIYSDGYKKSYKDFDDYYKKNKNSHNSYEWSIAEVKTNGLSLYLKITVGEGDKYESYVRHVCITSKKYQHVLNRFHLNRVVIIAGDFSEKERALDLARSLNKKSHKENVSQYSQEVWEKHNDASNEKSYVVVAAKSKELLKEGAPNPLAIMKSHFDHKFSVTLSDRFTYKLEIPYKE